MLASKLCYNAIEFSLDANNEAYVPIYSFYVTTSSLEFLCAHQGTLSSMKNHEPIMKYCSNKFLSLHLIKAISSHILYEGAMLLPL